MVLKAVLPKIIQWEDIAYANDFICQKCGKSGHPRYAKNAPNLVGWCETNNGFMAVFECTECFSKFRYHPQLERFDWKDFENTVLDIIEMGQVANSNKLLKELEETESMKKFDSPGKINTNTKYDNI